MPNRIHVPHQDAISGGATTLERELDVARALALRAGETVLRQRREGFTQSRKAGDELVTSADLEADRIIRTGLAEAFPDDPVLSEEHAPPQGTLRAPRCWIIDPIDGTRDYAGGGDEYAISIGLAAGGRAVLGVVHNPARGEVFAGTVTGGATLDGTAVHVTLAHDLASARLTMSRTEWESGLDRLGAALPVRPMSSAAYKLARVAAGLDDGTFSLWPRKEWDVCAGVALVRAASGEVTFLGGSEVLFQGTGARLQDGLVAGGRELQALLRRELARLGLAPP